MKCRKCEKYKARIKELNWLLIRWEKHSDKLYKLVGKLNRCFSE